MLTLLPSQWYSVGFYLPLFPRGAKQGVKTIIFQKSQILVFLDSKSKKHKIEDAKTCTVVGAALYQDMLNGNLEDLHVELPKDDSENEKRYYWGALGNPTDDPADFFKLDNLFFSPRDTAGLVCQALSATQPTYPPLVAICSR